MTIKDILIATAVIGALTALALPIINTSREGARIRQCISFEKQMALAIVDYEARQHYLPSISTNMDTVPDVPGDASATTDSSERRTGHGKKFRSGL